MPRVDRAAQKQQEKLCLSISSMTIFKNNPPRKHPKIPRMRVPFSNNPYSVCKNRLMSSTPGLLLAVSQNCVFSMIIRPKMNFFKRFQLSIFLKFLGRILRFTRLCSLNFFHIHAAWGNVLRIRLITAPVSAFLRELCVIQMPVECVALHQAFVRAALHNLAVAHD